MLKLLLSLIILSCSLCINSSEMTIDKLLSLGKEYSDGPFKHDDLDGIKLLNSKGNYLGAYFTFSHSDHDPLEDPFFDSYMNVFQLPWDTDSLKTIIKGNKDLPIFLNHLIATIEKHVTNNKENSSFVNYVTEWINRIGEIYKLLNDQQTLEQLLKLKETLQKI